ncbi:MAG: enoyl-CoA hydratase/isomerase family protein [Dehalobacterium sp.]
MNFETLTYEVDEKVVRIGLNRPKALNAVDGVMKKELLEAIKMVSKESEILVAVIFGHGKSFSTGIDLKDQAYNPWEHSPNGWGGHFDAMINISKEIWELEVPVIIAVKGYCLGAGCDLAVTGDFTYASEDAKFGEPEVRHGAFAPTLIIPWTMGMKKSKDFLLMGNTLTAYEAKEQGMITDVFPLKSFDEEVEKCVRHLCKMPKPALKVAKKAINKGFEMMGMWEAIQYNRELITLLALNKTKEQREARNELIRQKGLKAFLAERDSKF